MTDSNHDVSADEVRRQLRDLRARQRVAVPAWRRAIERVLDPASGATTDDKAALLGVPRRTFVVGGAVLAGGVVLAACGSENETNLPLTGELPEAPDTTTTTTPGSAELDRVLLQTAQSIEILAVETYDKALDTDLVTDDQVKEVMRLFRDQHEEHGAALTPTIRDLGGSEVTDANEYLLTNVVDPAVADLTDEESVLALARELENVAAQTYVKTGSVLTTGELRMAAMAVGEIEARHVTVLNTALGYTPVPVPYLPTGAAIDPKGYIE